MGKNIRNRILFILPPVIIAVLTWVWLFHEDGRWYHYREEWPWGPLLVFHLLFPVFYLIIIIVRLVRHINRNTRTDSDIFYIVSSIILSFVCFVGLLVFLIMTSGV